MVLAKEYRVCMPITVEEVSKCTNFIYNLTLWLILLKYHIGQLYMIARHSLEQSDHGEGVEVVENRECEDSVNGKGQYTEKRIHLSRYVHIYILIYYTTLLYF